MAWRIKGIKLIDIINPIKWFAYLNGMALKQRETEMSQLHIIEQLMYRSMRCKDCLVIDNHPDYPGKAVCIGKQGCEGCTCDTWGKMLLREETCTCNAWGPFRSKEDWEEYKIKYQIKFLLEFKGKLV